jgi:hypothetical protein
VPAVWRLHRNRERPPKAGRGCRIHAFCILETDGQPFAGAGVISTTYRVDQENVAWRIADSEAVLLHADSSAYFGLNRSATRLWEALAEHPRTGEELTRWASATFPGAPASLDAEVGRFLDRLAELQLVLRSENGVHPAAELLAAAPDAEGWESPAIEQFGELEKLILSGE